MDCADPRRPTEFRTSYTLSGFSEGPIQIDHVAIPAHGQAPRLAFFSCNGVQDKKDWTSRPEMERAWAHMLKCHKADPNPDGSGGPYHVLLGGGDQIYCDAVWKDIPELQALNTWEKRRRKKVTPALVRKIETLYANLYQRWRQSTFGDLHARIPGAYTWDDHDIFDGWGSYDHELQACDLFKEIPRRHAALSCCSSWASGRARPIFLRRPDPHALPPSRALRRSVRRPPPRSSQ